MSGWNPGRSRDAPLSARLRLRIADLVAVAIWPFRRRAHGIGAGPGIAERLNDVATTPFGRVVFAAACLELAALIARL